MKLSVIVPVYNEESLIDRLYERLWASLLKITDDFEVIFVDDGSTDKSVEKLLNIRKEDKRCKILMLSRNFGHQPAYTAGLNYARGEYVAMIDGDLQDPPELLPDMYDKLLKDEHDIVSGKRTSRKEGLMKRMLFSVFHKVFSRLSQGETPANVGNFSILNQKALAEMKAFTERNRYLPGLRFFIGFSHGFVEYKRGNREEGESMSLKSLFNLALDAIFSFSNFPLKFCLYVGMIGTFFFFCIGLFSFVSKLIGIATPGWSSILISIYFLGAVQLLFLGVIGEYVFRIYTETKNRAIYIVKDYLAD